MQMIDFATIDHTVAVAALGDLDLCGIDPEIAELVADDSFCNSLCFLAGLVFGVGELTECVPGVPDISCGLGFFSGAVEVIVSADLVEVLGADDLEVRVPHGFVELTGIGADIIGGLSNGNLYALDVLPPVVEAANHHSDDLLAVGEVNVGDLTLATAHAGSVEGVSLGDVLGYDLGETVVDIFVGYLCFLRLDFYIKVGYTLFKWGGFRRPHPTDLLLLGFVGALQDFTGLYRDRNPVCQLRMISDKFQKLLQGFFVIGHRNQLLSFI